MPMTEREVLVFTLARLTYRVEVTAGDGTKMHAFPPQALDNLVILISECLGLVPPTTT